MHSTLRQRHVTVTHRHCMRHTSPHFVFVFLCIAHSINPIQPSIYPSIYPYRHLFPGSVLRSPLVRSFLISLVSFVFASVIRSCHHSLVNVRDQVCLSLVFAFLFALFAVRFGIAYLLEFSHSSRSFQASLSRLNPFPFLIFSFFPSVC